MTIQKMLDLARNCYITNTSAPQKAVLPRFVQILNRWKLNLGNLPGAGLRKIEIKANETAVKDVQEKLFQKKAGWGDGAPLVLGVKKWPDLPFSEKDRVKAFGYKGPVMISPADKTAASSSN